MWMIKNKQQQNKTTTTLKTPTRSEVATHCVACGRSWPAQHSPEVLTPGNNETGVRIPNRQ